MYLQSRYRIPNRISLLAPITRLSCVALDPLGMLGRRDRCNELGYRVSLDSVRLASVVSVIYLLSVLILIRPFCP